MSNILCIYHGNCADGFGAAWSVRHALGDAVEFHAGVYQQPPPDVTGRRVVMVDFSYKRPVLEEMAKVAQSILILDHHKSAAEDLAGYPEPPTDLEGHAGWIPDSGVYATFDMERSGAAIAWDHFNVTERPLLINHIEDRDLWRFNLPGTREIQACVFSHPYDFELWSRLMASDLGDLRREGEAIERKHHKDIAELLSVCEREMNIAGYTVPAASLPYTLSSDAGHAMSKGSALFAACYWDTPEGRTFSLRSAEDGMDVSEIAKQFGGGGHKHAAGFSVPRDHELAVA